MDIMTSEINEASATSSWARFSATTNTVAGGRFLGSSNVASQLNNNAQSRKMALCPKLNLLEGKKVVCKATVKGGNKNHLSPNIF